MKQFSNLSLIILPYFQEGGNRIFAIADFPENPASAGCLIEMAIGGKRSLMERVCISATMQKTMGIHFR